MKKEQQKPVIKKEESAADLKTETTKKDPVHKGYNEKNPAQPQGAFTPDSKPGKQP
jgi:hypothetical protein